MLLAIFGGSLFRVFSEADLYRANPGVWVVTR
jgi:hypothetical protein